MKTIFNQKELEENLRSIRTILIVTHKNPTPDSLAASLALYLALSQSGKNVTIACPEIPTIEFSNLFAIDKITNVLGNKNFIISLDYKEGSIEKVSYNIEDNKFNLVIQPRAGSEPFSKEKVHFSQSGVSAEIIFIVDCEKLEDLDSFYTQEQEIYSKIPIVNIDTHQNNKNFGKINVVDYNTSSTTELTAGLLKSLNLPIDRDCATNLLSGIIWATDNFSRVNASAETFEIAAFCLRMGGRLPSQPSQKEERFTSQTPVITDFVTEQKDEKTKKPKPPPADWLEPKIYRGTSLS